MQRNYVRVHNDTAIYQHSLRDYEQWCEGIAVLDTAGIICYLNPAWQRFALHRQPHMSYPGTDMTFLDMIHQLLTPPADCMQAVERGLGRVLAGERDCIELEYRSSGHGQQHWFLLHLSALLVRGQRGVLVRQRDITYVPEQMSRH